MREATIAIFHGLGDCINATTLLKPIKARYPRCRIRWITSKPYAPLVANNPLIDEVIAIGDNPIASDANYKNIRKKYPNIITPAPSMNPLSGDGTLLGSFQSWIKHRAKPVHPFQPLLYSIAGEAMFVNKWLADRKINKYVMIETRFQSSQSFWSRGYTLLALNELKKKGYSILFTVPADPEIRKYDMICPSFCLNVSFRMMPLFYNRSSGFIGVSSGISCIVHTQQCRNDIPHIECVRGPHWSTKNYNFKKKKAIIYDKNPAILKSAIQRML